MRAFEEAVKLGSSLSRVQGALTDLGANRVIPRIWMHDYTVWDQHPAEITNRLGWLTAAGLTLGMLPQIQAFVEGVRADGYTHVLLLGMGGSSMAADVFSRVFGAAPGYLKLAVLDSTDAGAVLHYAETLDLQRTLFIVGTKSGGTAETLSAFKFFYNRLLDMLGRDLAGQHFVAITDPSSKLDTMATHLGFRETFRNDRNVGGRFSALTHFGVVPAALLGIDVARLLNRVKTMAMDCGPDIAPRNNPGAWVGAVIGEMAKLGRDKLTFVMSPTLEPFGYWVEQLIAESTGKDGKGILPVVSEPVGPPDIYGEDRVFVYLRLEPEPTHDAAVAALEEAGHPVVRLDLADVYDLGGQYFLWGMATAVAGHLIGVQPFNQPNVEAAKVQARNLITAYQERGELPRGEAAPLSQEALAAFLKQAQPGDYIALQAYVTPTPETDATLQRLCVALRERTRLAVTVGYGPRFLHSTGQLHKGDAGNGLFIQFTSDADPDVDIPIGPGALQSDITFGVLKMAQALGDFAALRQAGRRVVRFHLGTEVVQGLELLLA